MSRKKKVTRKRITVKQYNEALSLKDKALALEAEAVYSEVAAKERLEAMAETAKRDTLKWSYEQGIGTPFYPLASMKCPLKNCPIVLF